MRVRIFGCSCILVALTSTSHAQGTEGGSGASVPVMTGNIRVDLFGTSSFSKEGLNQDEPPLVPAKKSPWLAAGMSLLVPGAGEFYAESYWKSAAFFAVGVAAWTVAYTQNKKGDDQTASFEAYAQEHWDVTQYAQWTIDNIGSLNPSVDPTEYAVFDPANNVNWGELNRLERAIGGWYSHTLPAFGEQQYYELIGKYQQFYQGWMDANPALTTYDAVTNRLNAGGTQFTYYSAERGEANDFYSTSSTAVTVAVVTHVLSSVDAAWSASSYNKQIEAGFGFKKAMDGPIFTSYPAFEVSLGF